MTTISSLTRYLSLVIISFSSSVHGFALDVAFNKTECIFKTYDKSHALSTENAQTMPVSIFNHFTIPSGKPHVSVSISDPSGVKKEIISAAGHVEETVDGNGFGTYSACFTNKGYNTNIHNDKLVGTNAGKVQVHVHFFQPHHAISNEELEKELKLLHQSHIPGQSKGLHADQLHDSIALAESLMDDVQRIRGEVHYLTWRTKRHKQTVDSNALRTAWLTFLEVIVLCFCAWMQIDAVKGYFETSRGDLVEGGRSQGFEYQGKYESVRKVEPAPGFGPGNSNFEMPPMPQMFQSQQQQQHRHQQQQQPVPPPQIYQQQQYHQQQQPPPPPPQMYDAHKTQFGKNEEFQSEIPSQGILPNQYGRASAPQSRTGRQYQDR